MSLTKAVCEDCGTEEHCTTEYNYACIQNKVEKNLYSIFIFVADEDFYYVNCTEFFVSEVFFPAGGHIIVYVEVMQSLRASQHLPCNTAKWINRNLLISPARFTYLLT